MTIKPVMLITGATGFIGRNLVEHFIDTGTHEVIGVYHDRPPYEIDGLKWLYADLTKPEDSRRVLEGVDVLLQAAATTSGAKDIVSRPHIHIADNAVMNSYLFRSAHDLKVPHVVFFSCSIMLKPNDQPQCEADFDESDKIHHNYFGGAWTKVYLEKMAEFYSRLGHTKYTVIRHSNVYGPYDKFDLERSHVFGASVTKVMTAKDKVTVWGSGEEERDLLYVYDLMRFVELAVKDVNAEFNLYHCGAGSNVKIKDLVDKIIKLSGRSITVEHDLTKPTIPASIKMDCTKALKELGWKAEWSLDEGIVKTIDWWKENIHFASDVS